MYFISYPIDLIKVLAGKKKKKKKRKIQVSNVCYWIFFTGHNFEVLFDFLQNSFHHRCNVTGEKTKKSENREAESRRRNSGSKKDEEKRKMLSDHTTNAMMSENSSEPTTLTNVTFSLPKVEGF